MYTQGRTCISVMQTKCLTATVIVRGRQGDREGEKSQWCTPKTAHRSSANSCYCQQLQCSFPFRRNTHGTLHKMFHTFLHIYNTITTALVKVLKGKVNNISSVLSLCTVITYLNSITARLIAKKS